MGASEKYSTSVRELARSRRAEDQQQLQVRHFRGVLYGTSAVMFVVVAVLWIVGAVHPGFFPLCWPLSGKHPTMICPTGSSEPSATSVPLVLGIGALGAALSVALNLADVKPAGVRFSLTVAQGLNKIVLGAIIAVLGIIVLRAATNTPGFLATQPGLLTTAVVFGYSQQLFTRLIDRQANELTNAASPATPVAQLSAHTPADQMVHPNWAISNEECAAEDMSWSAVASGGPSHPTGRAMSIQAIAVSLLA